jgi:hypothetical protein
MIHQFIKYDVIVHNAVEKPHALLRTNMLRMSNPVVCGGSNGKKKNQKDHEPQVGMTGQFVQASQPLANLSQVLKLQLFEN